MNRRELLQSLVILSAGASLLPSCAGDASKPAVQLRHFSVNQEQLAGLQALSNAIIPPTGTPGSMDLGIPAFVLLMADDCLAQKDQQLFVRGLDRFVEESHTRFGSGFAQAPQADKNKFLEELDKNKQVPEELAAFYSHTKRFTIQGFTSSEYFLTRIQVYEMVPGRFHGCFPIKNSFKNG